MSLCQAREALLQKTLLDRGNAAISDAAAIKVVADETHDLSGEASLLGLRTVSAPATALARALRTAAGTETDLWQSLEAWLPALFAGAVAAASGSEDKDALIALHRAINAYFQKG